MKEVTGFERGWAAWAALHDLERVQNMSYNQGANKISRLCTGYVLVCTAYIRFRNGLKRG
jgi:hypothetical protein